MSLRYIDRRRRTLTASIWKAMLKSADQQIAKITDPRKQAAAKKLRDAWARRAGKDTNDNRAR